MTTALLLVPDAGVLLNLLALRSYLKEVLVVHLIFKGVQVELRVIWVRFVPKKAWELVALLVISGWTVEMTVDMTGDSGACVAGEYLMDGVGAEGVVVGLDASQVYRAF